MIKLIKSILIIVFDIRIIRYKKSGINGKFIPQENVCKYVLSILQVHALI